MSRVIEKLQSRTTGMRGIVSGRRMPLLSSTETHPTTREMQGCTEEYEMRVYVGTTFMCTPSMLSYAEEQARRMLARELYRDVYLSMDRLRLILSSYDYPVDMLEELDRLEEVISE